MYNTLNMLSTQTVSAREILRNYKSVFERIRRTRQPAIVMSQKVPQVAIVSLDDLKELQEAKYRKSTQALLDLAGIIPKGSGLPRDLSDNHTHYAWD